MKRNNPNIVPDYKFQEGEKEPKIASSNNWRTPDWLFSKVQDEFNLVVDRAADRFNHKLPYYFTKDDRINVLDMLWTVSGWMNHPYSHSALWFRKAHRELIERNVTTVCLAKVDPANNYWVETTKDAEIRYLAGRIKFWDDNNQPRHGATFSSALIIWTPNTVGNPSSHTWDYRGEVARKLF